MTFSNSGHRRAKTTRRLVAAALALGVAAAGCSTAEPDADGLTRSEAAEIAQEAAAEAAEGMRTELVGALDEMQVPETGVALDVVERVVSERVAEAAAEIASEIAGIELGVALEDVERVVSERVAEVAAEIAGIELGVALEDVERVVSERAEELAAEIGRIAAREQGVSADEIERLVRRALADAPTKDQPAAYTKSVIETAIDRYETGGLDATVAYYSSVASVDDQWYVFIIDESGDVIAHPESSRIGHNLSGPIGTDAYGFEFGTQMLAADADGTWVPYVYTNPARDSLSDETVLELKHAWVKRHDGLLFASGWYVDSEEFLPDLITRAAEHFRAGGLEAMIAFYNDPQGIAAGFVPTAHYYNTTGILGGFFSGFSATPDGTITSHIDPELIGTDIEDLLGSAVRTAATARGGWITAEDNAEGEGPHTMRVWVINVGGSLIGGGWYDATGDAS